MAENISSKIRLVVVQFSFSNGDAVPASVKRRAPETQEKRVERKSHSNGTLLVQPTERVSLASLPVQLVKVGFQMVDGHYENRIDANNPGKRYHAVRFVFAAREFVESNPEFLKVKPAILADFVAICKDAFWRVRAYNNPFFKDGEEVTEFRTFSVNMEARVPLKRADGTLVAGAKPGPKPFVVKPNSNPAFLGMKRSSPGHFSESYSSCDITPVMNSPCIAPRSTGM